MTKNKGVRVARCPIGQEYCFRPATSVKATDVASGASVAGRYQSSKRKGGNR